MTDRPFALARTLRSWAFSPRTVLAPFALWLVACPVPEEDLSLDKFVLQFTRAEAIVIEEVDGVPVERHRPGEVVQKRVTIRNASSESINLFIHLEEGADSPNPDAFTITTPVFEGLGDSYNFVVDGESELRLDIRFVGDVVGLNRANLLVEDPATEFLARVVLQGTVDCVSLNRDLDGDGFCTGAGADPIDCDDAPTTGFPIHPGAAEVCDEGAQLDQDCDGAVFVLVDLDDDGACDPARSCASSAEALVELCGAMDCPDGDDPAVDPLANRRNEAMLEVCEPGGSADQLDNDCEIGNEDAALLLYVIDRDDDGYGTDTPSSPSDLPRLHCGTAPVDYVPCEPDASDPLRCATGTSDCDDADVGVFPGAVDLCDGKDNDCDGVSVTLGGEDDSDGDGDGRPVCSEQECDDGNPAAHVGAPELCDGIDTDCDSAVPAVELDSDADNFLACEVSVAAALSCPTCQGGDCDDGDDTIFPGATEDDCDGLDNDCNGLLHPYELDGDGDGFACADDCDDSSPISFSGASELCDGVDNDCDGAVPADELDDDGDGYVECVELPVGIVLGYTGLVGYAGGSDCNDDPTDAAAPSIYPDAPEIADSYWDLSDPAGATFRLVDNQCPGDAGYDGDGIVGPQEYCEGPQVSAASTCDGSAPCFACQDGEIDLDGDGQTPMQGDCDETSAQRNAGLSEVCDGLDNDCDGGLSGPEADADEDGFVSCWPVPGAAVVGGDCDDDLADVRPGATEVADGLDNDCDATTDDPSELDLDGDCFCAVGAVNCVADPASACPAVAPGDCHDGNPAIYPGAPELCDELDNDCDGSLGAGGAAPDERDQDLDGYTPCGDADCADSAADLLSLAAYAGSNSLAAAHAIHPAAPEVCDGWNTDCTAGTPVAELSFELDDDGDGYVECFDNLGLSTALWGDFAGQARLDLDGANDCADELSDTGGVAAALPTIHPGASDQCDGWDNPCASATAPFAPPASSEFDDDGDLYIACVLSGPPALPTGLLHGGDCLDLTSTEVFVHPQTNQPVPFATSALVHPGTADVCDGFDTDCSTGHWDAEADNEDDDDGDKYLSCTTPAASLVPGMGPGDCLDNGLTAHPETGQAVSLSLSALVHPGVGEVCDGFDTDCSSGNYEGDADDEDDTDDDLFLACASAASSIVPGMGVGDCLDNAITHPQTGQAVSLTLAAMVRPNATEVCDGFDTNCSSGAFDADADNEDDDDLDNYVSCSPAAASLVPGFGVADCNDDDATIDPGEPDNSTFNLVDNDCDGTYDEESLVAGDILVNELLVTPSSAQETREWVELRNTSSRAIRLRSWTLTDNGTDAVTIGTDLDIASGGFAVLCRDPAQATSVGVTCANTSGWTTMSFSALGDALHLRAPDPSEGPVITVDSAQWLSTSGFGAPGVAIGFDPALSSNLSTSNDTTGNWCAQVRAWTLSGTGDRGTPGRRNASCAATLRDDDLDGYCELGRDLTATVLDGDCDDSGEALVNHTVSAGGACASAVCDCLDTNNFVFPTAPETCDGFDTDCNSGSSAPNDGAESDDDNDQYLECPLSGPNTAFVNHGATNSQSETLLGGNDCADSNQHRYPTNGEVCDGYDNDCNAATNVASGEADTDLDRYVPCSSFVNNGASNTNSQVLLGGADCADTNVFRFPTNPEICDGFDNDCSGATAPSTGTETDVDLDRYVACTGFVDHDATNTSSLELLGGADCADSNLHRYPTNPEVCDGYDNDCSSATGPASGNESDTDNDTYLSCGSFVNHGATNSLSQALVGGADCADAAFTDTRTSQSVGVATAALIRPGATEVCNAFDDNCSSSATGFPGDGAGETDADNDRYLTCTPAATSMAPLYAIGDCNDGVGTINPGAVDDASAVLVDNDCDGTIDEHAVTAGDLVVTEFLNQAHGGDPQEWFEVFNVTSRAINVLNWTLSDGASQTHTLPSLTIPAGGLVLLCPTPATANTDLPSTAQCLNGATLGTFTLGSPNDTIRLIATGLPSPLTVDNVTYSSAFDQQAHRATGFNPSLTSNRQTLNDTGTNWCTSNSTWTRSSGGTSSNKGTPGGQNSSCNTTLQDVDDDGYCAGGIDNNDDEDCDDGGEASAVTFDCLEGVAAVNPAASEVCDGYDNNCTANSSMPATGSVEADDDNDQYIPCLNTDTFVSNGAANSQGETILGRADCVDDAANTWSDDIRPGAAEVCDSWDTDCSVFTANGAPDQANEVDNDSDAYVDCGSAFVVGTVPRAGITGAGDCVDVTTVAGTWADDINPSETEVCDGWDTNCSVFGSAGAPDQANEVDNDGDTYIDCGATLAVGAVAPTGIAGAGDCVDSTTLAGTWADDINPSEVEVCDSWDTNCSTYGNAGVPDQSDELDDDGDGAIPCTPLAVGSVLRSGITGGGDCLDVTGNTWSDDVRPGASEVCDGWDTNCTNAGGGGAADVSNEQDNDADTYIDCSPLAVGAVLPSGIAGAGDCVDGGAAGTWADDINPGEAEVCDGWDTNCSVFGASGAADQANELDGDGDTYIDCSPLAAGAVLPAGITGVGDCVDGGAAGTWADDINPGEAEVCDGWDTNCSVFAASGAADQANEIDHDGDGYIDCATLAAGTILPAGITAAGDCVDAGAAGTWADDINPGEAEVCDGWDTNCSVFAASGAADQSNEVDNDDDTYIDCATLAAGAVLPAGITGAADCVDSGAAGSWADDINPGEAEVCDGWDTNCSVFAAAGAADQANEIDHDADGYIDCATLAAGAVLPAGITGAGDCVDGGAAGTWADDINPGEAEACDGWDTNCSVFAAAGAADQSNEIDNDADGYIDCATLAAGAVLPAGVTGAGDCVDSGAAAAWADDINPGAIELCDSWDTNCTVFASSGVPDAANETDNDADGYIDCSPLASGAVLRAGVTGAGDCVDTTAVAGTWADDINPGEVEVCDGWDTNCTSFGGNGAADQSNEQDNDADDYIDCAVLAPGTVLPAGLTGAGDCVDTAAAAGSWADDIRPGASEVCDSWDTDCSIFANSGQPDANNEVDNDADAYVDCAPMAAGAVLRAGITGVGDCVDTTAVGGTWADDINPGEAEVCDGWDTNCTVFASAGTADQLNEQDGDNDGQMTCGDLAVGAVLPGGISGSGDCNDGYALVFTGATIPRSPGSVSTGPACTDVDLDDFCLGGGEDLNADGDCADVDEDYDSRFANVLALAFADCNDGVPGVPPADEALVDGLNAPGDTDALVDEGCVGNGVGEVVITEMYSDDSLPNPDSADWFEVYNLIWHDVWIDGWVVDDDGGTDTFTVTGAPAGAAGVYLLDRGARSVLAENGAIAPAFPNAGDPLFAWGSGPTFSIVDIGPNADDLRLRSGANIIDVVNMTGFPNPPASTTLEFDEALIGLFPTSGGAFSQNDNQNNWCDGTGGSWPGVQGSPGGPNTDCP